MRPKKTKKQTKNVHKHTRTDGILQWFATSTLTERLTKPRRQGRRRLQMDWSYQIIPRPLILLYCENTKGTACLCQNEFLICPVPKESIQESVPPLSSSDSQDSQRSMWGNSCYVTACSVPANYPGGPISEIGKCVPLQPRSAASVHAVREMLGI